MLPPEPHLCAGILVQSSQEYPVRHRLVATCDAATLFTCAEDLSEPDLPGWVPVQLDVWPSNKQEIRFWLHRGEKRACGPTVEVAAALVDVGKIWYRLQGLRDNRVNFGIY